MRATIEYVTRELLAVRLNKNVGVVIEAYSTLIKVEVRTVN